MSYLFTFKKRFQHVKRLRLHFIRALLSFDVIFQLFLLLNLAAHAIPIRHAKQNNKRTLWLAALRPRPSLASLSQRVLHWSTHLHPSTRTDLAQPVSTNKTAARMMHKAKPSEFHSWQGKTFVTNLSSSCQVLSNWKLNLAYAPISEQQEGVSNSRKQPTARHKPFKPANEPECRCLAAVTALLNSAAMYCPERVYSATKSP